MQFLSLLCLFLAATLAARPVASTPPEDAEYFFKLRYYVKAQAKRRLDLNNFQEFAEFLSTALDVTYRNCKWAVAVFENSPGRPVPGFSSGTASSENCDVDMPPEKCARTGGLVHQPVEKGNREIQIALILRPLYDAIALKLKHVEYDEEQVRDYVSLFLDGMRTCAKDEKYGWDFTELASCVLNIVKTAKHLPPRALIISRAEKFGFSGQYGGVVIPSLNEKFTFPDKTVIKLATVVLVPPLTAGSGASSSGSS